MIDFLTIKANSLSESAPASLTSRIDATRDPGEPATAPQIEHHRPLPFGPELGPALEADPGDDVVLGEDAIRQFFTAPAPKDYGPTPDQTLL
eukprot:8916368-Pyramimonas_sp.AAC.1